MTFVLTTRQPIQGHGDERPDGEIDHGANSEEAGAEIAGLGLQDRIVGNGLRVAPMVQVMDAEIDRYEREQQPGELHHQSFRDASEDHAPDGAGQMVQHGEEQSAERQRGPEMERRQPAKVEPRCVDDQGHDTQRQPEAADGE
jgi:hypothetical protein